MRRNRFSLCVQAQFHAKVALPAAADSRNTYSKHDIVAREPHSVTEGLWRGFDVSHRSINLHRWLKALIKASITSGPIKDNGDVFRESRQRG